LSEYLHSLASFVPRLIVERANQAPELVAAATEQPVQAAVLFADIAGFTALTEDLARGGAAGAEELTRILNLYFGQMIDIVARHGGDIAKFAGDAMIALWPVSKPEDLPRAVYQVAACSLLLQRQLHAYEVVPGRRLAMKLAVGVGEVKVQHVGGVFDRWETILSGAPLGQVGIGNDHAHPGDIILSPEALAVMPFEVVGEPRPDGCLALTGLTEVAEPFPMADIEPRPETAATLRAFLPGAIRGRVDAGQGEWLGELRRIAVAFVNLSGFEVDTSLARAHEAFRALQIALYRFEGSINKISIDDKGASVLAVMGLPPLAHENDPERAVRAAMNIRASLEALGFGCAIGVTYGLAFCGVIGNARRREYTMMGDVVNLSARLMTAAKKAAGEGSGILVCHPTWAASRSRLSFDVLEPIRVKGKQDPQQIYQPCRSSDAAATVPIAMPRRSKLIGRLEERAMLGRRIDRLAIDRKGGLLLLRADPGMGKGRLLQELVGLAQDRRMSALVGSGDPIETATPYRPFRQILEALFPAADLPADMAARPTWMLDRLPADAELLRYAPLLGDLMDIDWPQNEALQGLTGRARAQKLQATVLRLLTRLAEAAPRLIVIKDAQWLDSASLATVLQLAKAKAPILLVLSARPPVVSEPEEWQALRGLPNAEVLELGPMNTDEIQQLVATRLGVDQLPDDIGRFIGERAEGNPLLAEELALSLRDTGLIAVEDRSCRRVGSAALEAVQLPQGIEGLITGRIDRLNADEQLAIKVASVIGRVFTTDLLADIHPLAASRDKVSSQCTTLERLELTPAMRGLSLLSGIGEGTQYKFKSNLTKEVAYNLMLFSQRRELHHRLAQWLEQHADGEQPAVVTLLAHHWEHAAEDREPIPEVAYKAVQYRGKAARMALAANAEREAIEGYRQALRLLQRLPPAPQRDRAELALLLELGTALVNATSWSSPEVRALYTRANELGTATGDQAALFRALRGEWQYLIGRADYDAAMARADDLVRLAQAAGDDTLLVEAHRAVGSSHFWTGDFSGARIGLERALALYDPDRHGELARSLGQDPEVAIRGILAWALAFLGEPVLAREHVRAATGRAEALRHPFSQVFAAGAGMWLEFFQGEPDAAGRFAATARNLSLERGFAYIAAAASVVHGWSLVRAGQAEAGLTEIARTVAGWEVAGGGIGLPLFLLVRGRALLEAGQPAEAVVWLEDSRLVRRVATEGWYGADRLGWLGQAQRLLGNVAAAILAEQQAEALAKRQQARLVLERLNRGVKP